MAKDAALIASLEALPVDPRLFPLLQAIMQMEQRGVRPAVIDRGIRRAYRRLPHTEQLANAMDEFESALAHLRREMREHADRSCSMQLLEFALHRRAEPQYAVDLPLKGDSLTFRPAG